MGSATVPPLPAAPYLLSSRAVATDALSLPCQRQSDPPAQPEGFSPSATAPVPRKSHRIGASGRSDKPPGVLRGCPSESSQKPPSTIATRDRRCGGCAATNWSAADTLA